MFSPGPGEIFNCLDNGTRLFVPSGEGRTAPTQRARRRAVGGQADCQYAPRTERRRLLAVLGAFGEGEDGGDAASTKIKSSYEKCEESAGTARNHANELLQGWPVITVEWEVVRNVRVRIGEWVK